MLPNEPAILVKRTRESDRPSQPIIELLRQEVQVHVTTGPHLREASVKAHLNHVSFLHDRPERLGPALDYALSQRSGATQLQTHQLMFCWGRLN
jgi:hypothetical protein